MAKEKLPVKEVRKSAPLTKKDVSYKSDMIGLPGTSFRKKVDASLKGKKVDSPAKMIKEKGSFEKEKMEKYASKSAMAKHEKKESKSFEKKENKAPVKKSPAKMKKC